MFTAISGREAKGGRRDDEARPGQEGERGLKRPRQEKKVREDETKEKEEEEEVERVERRTQDEDRFMSDHTGLRGFTVVAAE